MTRQLSQGPFHAVTAEQPDVPAHVIHLLDTRGPCAVIFGVVLVGIDSFQAFPRRAWPHVLKKVREIFSPLFAHPDSASAISFVFGSVRVIAAGLGIAPDAVFAGVPASMPEIEDAGGSHFCAETAATSGAPGHKAASQYQGFISAFATAIPPQKLILLGPLTEYRETAKHLIF